MQPKDADNRMANSVNPDQEQSDLGLHCLPKPVCPKTWDHYGLYYKNIGTPDLITVMVLKPRSQIFEIASISKN